MGLRGPAPEDSNVRQFKGNPGKRPVNRREPDLSPAPLGVAPPERLKVEAAKREWIDKYDELVERGVLRRVDVKHFEDYCYMVGELSIYEALAEQVGPDAAILRGYQGQKAKLRAQILPYRDRLGIDPVARKNVKAVETKPESKLSKFLTKG